jgi:taurine dioxygenase
MLELHPLSPGFGLEARGVDLATPLDDATFVDVERAFFQGQVLAFRDQHLSPAQFAAFARRFGPPEPHVIDQFHHPADPNILILSNRVENGKPAGLADAGTYFHTDYSYLDVPARATTLYSIEVPEAGGNTLFANQYAAYDDLDEATKQRIDPLVAVHHYGNRNNVDETTRTVASVLSEEQKAKMPLRCKRWNAAARATTTKNPNATTARMTVRTRRSIHSTWACLSIQLRMPAPLKVS